MDEAVKTTAEAESFEEFKAIRRGDKKEPEPAAGPKEPPTTPPSDKGSESAAVSEIAKTKTNQEEEKRYEAKGAGKEFGSHDRSLEARVKELRGKGEHEKADKILRDAWTKDEKARADRLEEELRTLRTRKPEPETKPAPVETPKPTAEAATHPEDESMPKIDDPKYQVAGGYEQYLEDRALTRWRNEQRGIERQKRDQDFKSKVVKTLEAGRTAHADFDAVAFKVQVNKQVLNDAIARLDNVSDVLYQIGSDAAEMARFAGLDPLDQYAELKSISRDLAKGAKAAAAEPIPEEPKPKTPVSKVAPPPRSLSGGRDDGPQLKLADSRSYEEFRELRKRKSA